MMIRIIAIILSCGSWIGGMSQVKEALLFPPCPLSAELPDSLRGVSHVRIYDGCWLEFLDRIPGLKRLDAMEIQLEGSFPPGELHSLRYLSVQNNEISHIICRNLPLVEELDLAGNPLDEASLAGIMDSLPRLKSLRIGGSSIRSLELPESKWIRHLDMCCESDLTRIYGVRSAMRLEKLVLAGCSLEGNELDIRECRVDSLDLSFNQIAMLDAEGLPGTLEYLDLSYNPFSGFNGRLGRLQRLETLDMRGCGTGAMHSQLSKQKSISKLLVDGRGLLTLANEMTFKALPPRVEELWIDLDSGLEPPKLASIKELVHIIEISFYGNVPTDLSALSGLNHLSVIRIEGCNSNAIDLGLASLGNDRRLVVWVPQASRHLKQKYPHFEIRVLE